MGDTRLRGGEANHGLCFDELSRSRLEDVSREGVWNFAYDEFMDKLAFRREVILEPRHSISHVCLANVTSCGVDMDCLRQSRAYPPSHKLLPVDLRFDVAT